jgi:GntR family transcriptional regulator
MQLFRIDKFSRIPIYEQIIKEIERLVAAGILEAESLLPSVRNLSQELGINPNTLQKAYSELERRNICYSVPGSARYICPNARSTILESKKESLGTIANLTEELIRSGISIAEIIQCVQQAGQKASVLPATNKQA